ncbi:MAG: RIP metalloprotease RseP [Cellvibrionaceae bacterium]|nr:RIP metalloprotease RseP [Cellvibrionaceae bacterium]
MLTTLIGFLVALLVLVSIHEFGHFYVARRCGVKVLRFSIGFGRPLYTWHDAQGTAYTLAAIPLGGFVKMLDEREGEVPAAQRAQAFTQKTVWQRMAIVAAGPAANVILAVVLYFVLALQGIQGLVPVIAEVADVSPAARAQLSGNQEIVAVDGNTTSTWAEVYQALGARIGDTGEVRVQVKPFVATPQAEPAAVEQAKVKAIAIEQWLATDDRPALLAALGITPMRPPTDWVLATVVDDGAAALAGVRPGDKLLAYDGVQASQWQAWVDYVQARPGQAIVLTLLREGQRLQLTVTPRAVEREGRSIGAVGVAARAQWPEAMLRTLEYSVLEAGVYGLTTTWEQALLILSFLKKLLFMEVSVKHIGGTLTIAEVAGESASAGMADYLRFLALFSVSLAVFNVLPIPVLDGGHFLFYLIEAISGKPLPETVQLLSLQLGLAVILSIMVLAHYNDLVRLFTVS